MWNISLLPLLCCLFSCIQFFMDDYRVSSWVTSSNCPLSLTFSWANTSFFFLDNFSIFQKFPPPCYFSTISLFSIGFLPFFVHLFFYYIYPLLELYGRCKVILYLSTICTSLHHDHWFLLMILIYYTLLKKLWVHLRIQPPL